MKLPVTLCGKVIHGRSLGNTYDCPTANILPTEDIGDLPFGVYYSVIKIEDKNHPAITNLGVRPTVSNDGSVCAETYVYDYSGDLYGKTVAVTLLDFRRGEQKFDNVDQLFATIDDDFRQGRIYHGI